MSLPLANTWVPVDFDADDPAGGEAIAGTIMLTGLPATLGAAVNNSVTWTITLNAASAPSDLTIDRYGGGVVVDHPITISYNTGAITFSNPVLLVADPTVPLGAATKNYVDTHVGLPANAVIADLKAQTVVQSGATLAINRALGENCILSLTASITSVSITGWPAAGTTGKLRLMVLNTGAFSIVGWPANVGWPNGLAPTISSGAGKRDQFQFSSDDGGVTVYGTIIGQSYATAPAPTNTATPAVTGTPNVGATLSCTTGTWTGSPTGYAYQWQRDGAAIAGAASSTYVTVTADAGHNVGCTVTATNANGSVTANSNTLAIVALFTFPGTPIGVYSVRKAGAGYAGMCMKVQRTGDNALQDIGFTSAGVVDMGAIATFLSGSAGSQALVSTWYDQSGNARNLTSSGSYPLPQINSINGKPYLCFIGTGGTGAGPILATAAAVPGLTGDQTIGFVGQLQNNYVDFAVAQFDNTNGWFLNFSGSGGSGTVGSVPGSFQYFTTGGGGVALDDSGRYYGKTNRYVTKRASGNGTVYVNGVSTKTGAAANNVASTAAMTLGGNTTGTFNFTGLIGEVFIYNSALVDADRNTIDAAQASFFPDTGFATPYSGAHAVGFDYSGWIGCGSILNYARTNTWTVFSVVQLFMFPSGGVNGAALIYTNVPSGGSAFPGHEIWVDYLGRLRVRIMSNIGANNYIGLIGQTSVVDGVKHAIAYSYDGSSTAAGVKVYVDGVLQTMTIESDTLTGAITAAGQSFYIGNQQGFPGFNLTGVLSFFQIDNVVRNQSYIMTNFTSGAIPPVASTDIRFIFNEGSGTTTADGSGNSHTGTFGNAAVYWVP